MKVQWVLKLYGFDSHTAAGVCASMANMLDVANPLVFHCTLSNSFFVMQLSRVTFLKMRTCFFFCILETSTFFVPKFPDFTLIVVLLCQDVNVEKDSCFKNIVK